VTRHSNTLFRGVTLARKERPPVLIHVPLLLFAPSRQLGLSGAQGSDNRFHFIIIWRVELKNVIITPSSVGVRHESVAHVPRGKRTNNRGTRSFGNGAPETVGGKLGNSLLGVSRASIITKRKPGEREKHAPARREGSGASRLAVLAKKHMVQIVRITITDSVVGTHLTKSDWGSKGITGEENLARANTSQVGI